MRHHLAQVMHREARKSRRIDIETSALATVTNLCEPHEKFW